MKLSIPTILVIALALAVPCPAVIEASGRRVALVIGNSAYETAPLRNPVNDAVDMGDLLEKLGFEVILKTDADKRTMIAAIEEFGRMLPQAEIGLVFFAGHGMQIKGRNYLIPVQVHVSSETDVEIEAVDVYRILGRMEAAGNPTNIIILDACRDNPFERSFRSTASGLAKLDAPAGSLIAFATSPGGVAADGSGRNGVFTRHLMHNLAHPDVSLTQALMRTRRAVSEETGRQQIPWDSSSLMQDVFFASTGTAMASADTVESIEARRVKLEADIAAQRTKIEQDKAALVEAERLRQEQTGLAELEAERNRLAEEARQLAAERERLALQQTEHPRQIAMAPRTEPPPDERTWTEPHTGMEFVWVPGGCFQMGCGSWTDQCWPDENPVHEVCVNGFWMGRTEVTQAQWEKIMGSTSSKHKTPKNLKNPVENVSWDDVQKFIRELNSRGNTSSFRLPREAEWEYACRSGGKQEKYCGGNDLDRVGWYINNSRGKTQPVGGKAPNSLGLHDMSGNVWEWCLDAYDDRAYSRTDRQQDPEVTGNESSERVYRGGSWSNGPGFVRGAFRRRHAPDYKSNDLGFRLLRTSLNE